jgi:hypothetical protein
MLKEKEVAEDAPIETSLGAHPKEAVDVEVVKICYRQKLTWSIWAKKRAAIKMGFEDNHD